mmetsp:Transcript_54/g.112  ORF Transcript_54/g.112 Transcript_54/m.112 type:complete len:804 (-) Transcript_54:345-2756(-)
MNRRSRCELSSVLPVPSLALVEHSFNMISNSHYLPSLSPKHINLIMKRYRRSPRKNVPNSRQGHLLHHTLLLVALLIPQAICAWTNDSRDNPSNDQSSELVVELSLFLLKIFHPWTNTGTYLDANTTEAIRTTSESVLTDALHQAFQEIDAGNDTQVIQFQAIELETQGVNEFRRLVESQMDADGPDSLPRCPCSTIAMSGRAVLVPSSSSAPASTSGATSTKDVDTTSTESDGESTHTVDTSYLDDLVRELLRHGGAASKELKTRLQQQIAFFSEGQGFDVRLVEPTETTAFPTSPPSLVPTIKPNVEPTTKPTSFPSEAIAAATPSTAPTADNKRLQAPPRPITPPPTPANLAANGSTLGSRKQPSERSVFLVGAILGACFFAFALLLLHRIENKKRTKAYITNETDEKDEEIDFYPNHTRPTPQSYRYNRHSQEDPELVLEPDGTSLKLESDCLFEDRATQLFNQEHGTSSPNKPKWPFSDDISAPSQSFGLADTGTFEIESLQEEERPVPVIKSASAVSTLSNEQVRHTDGPIGLTRSDVSSTSLFDEIMSPIAQAFGEGWATFSVPWVENTASKEAESFGSFSTFPPTQAELYSTSFPPLTSSSEESGTTTTSSSSPQSTNTSRSTDSASASTESYPPLAQPNPLNNVQKEHTPPHNDDGSFHGSVESVDSLISSCWDPNDNSNSDVAHGRQIPIPGIRSSFSSELTEEVSFYHHVSFMKWAQRAKKSLQAANTIDQCVEPSPPAQRTPAAISEEEAKKSTRNTMPGDRSPYLSVSFSESTESFDENGFKVVNNSSFV